LKQHLIYTGIICVISALLSSSVSAQLSFHKYVIDNNTNGMGGIHCCDVDGDNDMDVLAASIDDNQIIWFENTGGTPIHWIKHTIGSGVIGAHSVFGADFDLDGDNDVIGAAYEGSPGIALWKNNGGHPIQWVKYPVAGSNFYNVHEIFAIDLDKDGDMDILGASSNLNRIAWWRNDRGDPIVWTQQVIGNNFSLAKSVCAGDIDNDGDNDVIGASITGNAVCWWRNDGGNPIAWTKFYVDSNFIGAHRVQVCNLDNDAFMDVLGAGYLGHQIAWWRNSGTIPVQWTEQVIENSFINACVAFAADLNNDGYRDVLGSAQGLNQLALWLNHGGSPVNWEKIIVDSNFYRVWPLYACDLDNDSDTDIVAGSSHNGNFEIRWYENLYVISVKNTGGVVPEKFILHQNFPNPFNPVTRIEFSVPERIPVSLKVYDVLGREIRVLVDEVKPAGNYYAELDGSNLPSGVYYYSLTAGGFIETKKMILLK
jgi:hypothetical protein